MTALSERPTSVRIRPITMAILAMGGEGGGVLSDWIVALAEDNDWFAQSTSVPGVAQRTGATVYYVELFPKLLDGTRLPEPILSTMPTPGEVDIVVASELMEAGRAVQRGFTTPERTTLIASTSRTYSMPERTAMGDGRVDSEGLVEACLGASKRFVRGDFSRVAEQSRSVISAVLFGAICGSHVLPFSREQFESAVRASGKGVEASLKAFDGGFRAATTPPPVTLTIGARPADTSGPNPAEVERATTDPVACVGPRLSAQAERIMGFPAPARYMLVQGIKRTAEYQDVRYADEYLDRVASIAALEQYGDDAARLTTEAARYTALWMTYEDTIRVAFHKTRERRMRRVGEEAHLADGQVLAVHEYLHPQIEEITDTLPTPLGRWMLRSTFMNAIVYKITHKGITMPTTSLFGFTVLYLLARLRPLRRRSLRFGLEQKRIDDWLDQVRIYAARNYDLAYQIVECQQVVKGYGETHASGMRNFTALMGAVPRIADDPRAAQRLANLRKAALADEKGETLRAALASASMQ
jgi:indolepyruvate ferredoxin oxidoreductase beta subunit